MGRSTTAIIFTGLLALSLLSPSTARVQEPPDDDFAGVSVSAGVGLPELIHAEVGYFLTPRLDLEAQYKYLASNHFVGLGATGYFFGQTYSGNPPRHAILGSVSLVSNPTLGQWRLTRDAQTIGSAAGLYFGYGFVSDKAFSLKILGGTLLFADDGLAYTPSLNLSAGFAL